MWVQGNTEGTGLVVGSPGPSRFLVKQMGDGPSKFLGISLPQVTFG